MPHHVEEPTGSGPLVAEEFDGPGPLSVEELIGPLVIEQLRAHRDPTRVNE
ncbi:hypothetical protein ACFO1B_03575 [Dactylosporangium siamense]|uniref:FXSXX-COOH protein n=1 Tax=Dactylosporangium siamense TaxID=685454 RepID=A0A919PG84_9ACTN|nr:hypothetical protein [Dactylosporangium siamense]GIG43039.1 hypothetical protein Dsi01nite_010800 [Dactylosporangium siamense]